MASPLLWLKALLLAEHSFPPHIWSLSKCCASPFRHVYQCLTTSYTCSATPGIMSPQLLPGFLPESFSAQQLECMSDQATPLLRVSTSEEQSTSKCDLPTPYLLNRLLLHSSLQPRWPPHHSKSPGNCRPQVLCTYACLYLECSFFTRQ